MKLNIPNYLTFLRILLIPIIILLFLSGDDSNRTVVFILFVIASVTDYLDGFFARKLNAKSDIGLQLDSLADLVSFGLVPGILLYNMFNAAPSSSVGSISSSFVPFTGFLITLCSAYRLARFNTRKSSSKYFKGLATPANTVLIYSLSIISADGSIFSKIILDYNILFLITVVSGVLLVSNLKLLNFKFKSLKFKGNRRRFFILFISIPSLVFLGVYAIPVILSLYILISIFTFYKFKTK